MPGESKFNKLLIAILGAVGVWIQSATSDDLITNPEWVQLGNQMVTAIGIGLAANFVKAKGIWHYTKGLVAGTGALFTAWLGYLANNDHLDTSMKWNIGISAVTALVLALVGNNPVTLVDNAEPTPPTHT